MNIIHIVIAAIIGYIFGSIPFALVIGKVFYHKDVREYGSHNLGGTNAGRVLGKKAGLCVIILDALKAFFAMCLVSLFDKDVMVVAGFMAAVGHCYPLFASFKGGKAVATICGYIFGLIIFGYIPFYNGLIPLLIFFIVLKLSKYVSLSSITMILIAAIMTFINSDPYIALTILLLWCFTTYRHKANIKRIKDGTESKIKWMK